MNREEKIQKRLQEHLDILKEKGYNIFGIFLQGSQNYELDYEGSDIDTKAMILPSLDDIIFNRKPVSTTLVLDNNEHIDVKDIRLMFGTFKKQNINFLEILFTDFFIINNNHLDLYLELNAQAELIAKYDNYAGVKCMCGMAMEKYKALEHPYPATIDKIEKFGYDPKQLHHILRLKEFLTRRINGESFCGCLVSEDSDYLLSVKLGLHDLETARTLAKEAIEEMGKMKDEYKRNNSQLINTDAEEVLNSILRRALTRRIQEQLFNSLEEERIKNRYLIV